MFKEPCCHDLKKTKKKLHFVVLSCSERRRWQNFINLYLLSYSLRLLNALNTLAGLNLLTSS